MIFIMTGEVLAVSPSSQKKQTKKSKKEDPITITADHVEQLGEKNLVRARGHVFIRYRNRFIKADKVLLNTRTGIGKAIGHVLVGAEDGTRIRAKRSYFNLKSKKGKMIDARGRIGEQYYVTGKEFRKLGTDHYQVDKASLTTCKGKIPDWVIEVNALDMKVGDRALFQGAVIRVRDIPIFYFPFGYVPLDTSRKSGFLIPSVGSSSINGFSFENSFFWAINQWSDATFDVNYFEKRGVQFGAEYRYAPNKNTRGEIRATYLDDDLTDEAFWEVKGFHKQKLQNNVGINARVDLTSDNNFSRTFSDRTKVRTRRSTDSFIAVDKGWTDSSLDIISRFRKSIEENEDEIFVTLPQLTSKSQLFRLWNTPVYFTQESSYTGFLVDLVEKDFADDLEHIHRIDVHPQLAMPFRLGSLFSVTPKVGVRATLYNKGLRLNQIVEDYFIRELVDFGTVLEGPKFEKVFSFGKDKKSLYKHIIEPRVFYDYIPDMDEADRFKIRVLDHVDEIGHTNKVKFSLIQRLFRKDIADGESKTSQRLRFEISQSYDFVEADRAATPSNPSQPFSNLRFDLDSQPFESFLLNFDAEFNPYRGVFETVNFEVGVKPTDWMSLTVDRRQKLNGSRFLLASLDLNFSKGWRFQVSSRYDERRQKFQENNVSVLYSNKCNCWGFGLDYIRRNNIIDGVNEIENKFMFTIELRGIGSISTGGQNDFIHKTF